MKDTTSKMHPLKNWRLSKGYTQEQAGSELGISRVTFHRFENGERIPDRNDMPRVCSHTGLSPNDFYSFSSASMGDESGAVA
ncbi:MAG: helix-turn-helix transcriptional regulator [Alphaproteobacteria bacterium]|nr:helix-turn-helix transcriptional regulator [Alphaproteobacteria bacterium]